MVINKHLRKNLGGIFKRRLSRRTAVLVAGVIAAVALLGGGSYALFWGGADGPAASYSSVNLSKGLVGYWKFDDSSFTDSTPNHIACSNLYAGSGFTSDRFGKANDALDPGGLGLDCGAPTALQLSSAVSVSAWVKPTAYNSANSGVMSYGVDYQLYFQTDGHLVFLITDDSYNIYQITSPSTYALNSWYFIAATFDGTTMRLYVNGTQVGTTAYSGTIGATLYASRNFIIGGYNTNSSTSTFEGPIDSLRVYNRGITDAEVTALYHSYDDPMNLGTGESGLVGWWKLNGNLNDSTPNRNTGVMEYGRSAVYAADRYGTVSGAQTFNGGNDCDDVTADNLFPNTDFTINVWVNNSSLTASNLNLLGQYDSNPIAPTLQQGTASGNMIYQLWSSDGATQYDSELTNFFTTTGKWTMVTWVKSGSTLTFYKNGQVFATGSGPAGKVYIDTSQPYQIGCAHNYWAGSLSDFRIYDRAISTQEITNLYSSYNSQLSIGGGGQATGINLQKGLVGHWAMDGNVNDSTPYRTVCTPPTSSPSYASDRNGRAYSAMSPPKLGMDCGQPTALQATNVTMSAWINSSTLNTGGNGIESYGGTVQLYVDGTNNVACIIHDSTNAAHGFSGTATLNLGQWYFVTMTYDGSNVDIYVNGVLDTSTSYTGGIGVSYYGNSGNDFELGVYGAASTGRSFKGLLDDVRIYNRALSPDEIKALYNEYQ